MCAIFIFTLSSTSGAACSRSQSHQSIVSIHLCKGVTTVDPEASMVRAWRRTFALVSSMSTVFNQPVDSEA
jgi:hypothetical protein